MASVRDQLCNQALSKMTLSVLGVADRKKGGTCFPRGSEIILRLFVDWGFAIVVVLFVF